jgi:hypothetical protein
MTTDSHPGTPLLGRRRTCCAALTLLLISAACGRSDATSASKSSGEKMPHAPTGRAGSASEHRRRDVADLYVATLAREVSVPEALLTGALRIHRNCLVFDSGGQVSLALVPAGTRLDGARGEIALGAVTVPLGKELRFGGGSYPAGHEVFGTLADPVPQHCPRSGTLIGDVVR